MKHYISRLLTITLVTMATISAQAYDFEVDGICYNITEGNICEVTYLSTSFNSYSGNVVIPSTVINGKPYIVRGIGSNAFKNCKNLSSITIPNTVTSIGENAFYCCTSLSDITIPNSVTSIGSYAFYG